MYIKKVHEERPITRKYVIKEWILSAIINYGWFLFISITLLPELNEFFGLFCFVTGIAFAEGLYRLDILFEDQKKGFRTIDDFAIQRGKKSNGSS